MGGTQVVSAVGKLATRGCLSALGVCLEGAIILFREVTPVKRV